MNSEREYDGWRIPARCLLMLVPGRSASAAYMLLKMALLYGYQQLRKRMRRETVADLVALKLDFLRGDPHRLAVLGIRRSDRGAVDFVYCGATVEFPALQNNIGH
jgi:hypothetical protein